MSKPVRITYHSEAEAWWADSPDVEGFVASGADLAEVRQLVHEGLPFYLDDASVEIVEQSPWPTSVVVEVRLNDSLPGASLTSTSGWWLSEPRNVVDHLSSPYLGQSGRQPQSGRQLIDAS